MQHDADSVSKAHISSRVACTRISLRCGNLHVSYASGLGVTLTWTPDVTCVPTEP